MYINRHALYIHFSAYFFNLYLKFQVMSSDLHQPQSIQKYQQSFNRIGHQPKGKPPVLKQYLS